MIFEEALKLMREGEKITHPYFEKDEYFSACRIGIIGDDKTPIEERPISIVKMKGEYEHPDMRKRYFSIIFEKPCEHGNAPQLNLFLVMSNEWELYIKKE